LATQQDLINVSADASETTQTTQAHINHIQAKTNETINIAIIDSFFTLDSTYLGSSVFFQPLFAELINHASKTFPNCFNGYCKLKGEHICLCLNGFFLCYFSWFLTAQKYDLFSTICSKTITRESDCKVFLKK